LKNSSFYNRSKWVNIFRQFILYDKWIIILYKFWKTNTSRVYLFLSYYKQHVCQFAYDRCETCWDVLPDIGRTLYLYEHFAQTCWCFGTCHLETLNYVRSWYFNKKNKLLYANIIMQKSCDFVSKWIVKKGNFYANEFKKLLSLFSIHNFSILSFFSRERFFTRSVFHEIIY